MSKKRRNKKQKQPNLVIRDLHVLEEQSFSHNDLRKAWGLDNRFAERNIQSFISRNKAALEFLEIKSECLIDEHRIPSLSLSASKYVGCIPLRSPKDGTHLGNLNVEGKFNEDISELLSIIGEFIPPEFNESLPMQENIVRPPLFFECMHYIDDYIAAKRIKWRKFDNIEKIQPFPTGSTNWSKYIVLSADPHKALQYPNRCNILSRNHPEWHELNYVLKLSIDEILSPRTPLRSRQAYLQKIDLLKNSSETQYTKLTQHINAHMADPIEIKRLKESANIILDNTTKSHLAWRIDLSLFFERYVQFLFNKVARAKGASAYTNPKYNISGNAPLWALKYIEPDVLIQKNDIQYIIDAKYKAHMYNINKGGEELKESFRSDLHQVLAYSAFGKTHEKNVLLVYPSGKYLKKELRITNHINGIRCNVFLVGIPLKKDEMKNVLSELGELLSF